MSIKDALFAVERDGAVYQIVGSEIQGKCKDGDMFAVWRAGTVYQWKQREVANIDEILDNDWLCCTDEDGVTKKVTGAQFKGLFPSTSAPNPLCDCTATGISQEDLEKLFDGDVTNYFVIHGGALLEWPAGAINGNKIEVSIARAAPFGQGSLYINGSTERENLPLGDGVEEWYELGVTELRSIKIENGPGYETGLGGIRVDGEIIVVDPAVCGGTEPEPEPDTYDPIVVKKDTRWSGNTATPIFAGEKVYGFTAKFSGGNPDVTSYRYKWQTKSDGGSWTNHGWYEYAEGDPVEVSFSVPSNLKEGDSIRLNSQAVTTVNGEEQLINSASPIESLGKPVIEVFYIRPAAMNVYKGRFQTFDAMTPAATARDLEYKWEVVSGAARMVTPDNEPSCQFQFNDVGVTEIQCTVTSETAVDTQPPAISPVTVS